MSWQFRITTHQVAPASGGDICDRVLPDRVVTTVVAGQRVLRCDVDVAASNRLAAAASTAQR